MFVSTSVHSTPFLLIPHKMSAEPIETKPTPDTSRWYLCKESQHRGQWVCVEQTGFEQYAKNFGYFTEPRSLPVAVPRWMPRGVDFIFINDALKQKFTITK